MTFEGSAPGPMIVVHEGDYVELTLVNPTRNQLLHNIDFHPSVGALTGGNALTANVGENVLVIHSQANRVSYPHLIGGNGDYVWERGGFDNPPQLGLETWEIAAGTAGASIHTFQQPGLYAYLSHNLIEAFILGAAAHFQVGWRMEQRPHGADPTSRVRALGLRRKLDSDGLDNQAIRALYASQSSIENPGFWKYSNPLPSRSRTSAHCFKTSSATSTETRVTPSPSHTKISPGNIRRPATDHRNAMIDQVERTVPGNSPRSPQRETSILDARHVTGVTVRDRTDRTLTPSSDKPSHLR